MDTSEYRRPIYNMCVYMHNDNEYNKTNLLIQGVSGGIVNILGGCNIDYSE
jgi:hypothetical protein